MSQPEALQQATQARSDAVQRRAIQALTDLAASDQPVTFAAVARAARISTDYLYRNPDLRERIERLRRPSGNKVAQQWPESTVDLTTTSSAVRALSGRLEVEQKRRREEVAELQTALAAAHGEVLELRRRLSHYEPE